MRYLIIRDDDTNALTPISCLERLYRPFLERGLPINLAAIPEVSTGAKMKDGRPEGFLPARDLPAPRTVPLGDNPALVDYLLKNPGYHIVQHGCHHEYLEFDSAAQSQVVRLLEQGTKRLLEAGFTRPTTFVAPYDKLSRPSLQAVAERFRVLSTGWYELRRLPYSWWPGYLRKKMRGDPHWQQGGMYLLSHPGCLLSYQRSYSSALQRIVQCLQSNRVTVLVTHWWEYFRGGEPDEPFIDFLHETLRHMANRSDVKVISFDDIATGKFPLN